MAEIRLENITKIFDRNIVGLKNFSLSVRDGEFVTVLGPSGSGKSTLLRIIAGLDNQDGGDVFIDELKVNRLPPQERDLAFVFQSYALYPHMDVEENIAVGLRLKGCSKSEILKRVREVAQLLEISELLKRKPKTLSGGQRQRVALARAIAKRPKAFLLDEPLSNLDAILREKMRAELRLLFEKIGGTVVYVTHDQSDAMSLSDRIALIEKGELQQAGSPDELYFQPKNIFVANFLGSPRINIFEVEIREGNFIFGTTHWKIPQNYCSGLKDRPRIIVGIRPEDLKVYSQPPADVFSALVIMVEKMGRFAILSLDWQGQILKAVVEKNFTERIEGRQVGLEFDIKKIYFFDKDTQKLVK